MLIERTSFLHGKRFNFNRGRGERVATFHNPDKAQSIRLSTHILALGAPLPDWAWACHSQPGIALEHADGENGRTRVVGIESKCRSIGTSVISGMCMGYGHDKFHLLGKPLMTSSQRERRYRIARLCRQKLLIDFVKCGQWRKGVQNFKRHLRMPRMVP